MPKSNDNIPNINPSAEGFDQIFLQLCANAPYASDSYVEQQARHDQTRNPHNETYNNSIPRRSATEIRADYAIDYALTILRRIQERRKWDWTV